MHHLVQKEGVAQPCCAPIIRQGARMGKRTFKLSSDPCTFGALPEPGNGAPGSYGLAGGTDTLGQEREQVAREIG